MSRSQSMLVCGLLMLAGVGADREPVPLAAQAKCDNKCRMRQEHRFCDGGEPCIKFRLFRCLLCSPGLNHLCETRDVAVNNCIGAIVNPDTTAEYYDACEDLCDCPGNNFVVESNMTGSLLSTIIFQRFVCD